MNRPPIVIVIDSDPRARRALSLILRDHGCDVIDGPDSAAIFERLSPRQPPPVAVVADFALQGPIDGVEAARLVIAVLGQCVPALILVDDHDRSARDAAERAGFAVLARPFATATLRFHLTGLLLPPCAP